MDKKIRTVLYENQPLVYSLERKKVRNLNLRVRRDGSVYVSASPAITLKQVDEFVRENGRFILSAKKRIAEQTENKPAPRQYTDGEIFHLMDRTLVLKVEKAEADSIRAEGSTLRLCLREAENFERREKIVLKYLADQCRTLFEEILEDIYPPFRECGIEMPVLRLRNMKTRWGTCHTQKKIITLNTRLLEMPEKCVRFVAMHEFCHLIHPNHSKEFYALLTLMMPDWKERRAELDHNAASWF